MGLDWPALEEEAVELLRAVAPELNGVPVYLVDAAKLVGSDFYSRQCYGVFFPGNDLIVQPFVHWQGRGVGIIYMRSTIIADFPDERSVRDFFLSLALHEAAHALEVGHLAYLRRTQEPTPAYTQEPTPAYTQAVRTLLKENIQKPAPVSDNVQRKDTLRKHGPDWLRCIVHLKLRAEKLRGLLLPLSLIWSKSYGTHVSLLAGPFKEEAERMADWPFERILAAPLPSTFTRLWIEDLGFFSQLYERENVVDLVKKISELFSVEKKTATEAYIALVRRAASDTKINPSDAAAILKAASKLPEDLQRDVEMLHRRRQLRQTFDAADGIDVERDRIKTANDAAEAELAAAQQKYDQAVQPLTHRERQLIEIERAANQARVQLEFCAPLSAIAHLKEVGAAGGSLSNERHHLGKRVAELRDAIKSSSYRLGELKANQPFHPGQGLDAINAESAKLTASESELQAARQRLDAIEVEVAHLEQLVQDARKLLLDP